MAVDKKTIQWSLCWRFVRARCRRTLLATCLGLSLSVCHATATDSPFGFLPTIV